MKKILLLFLLLLSPALRAAGADDAGDSADASATAATAIAMDGQVLSSAEGAELAPVALGQFFAEGDRLVTRENSSLQLLLADGSTLALGPNTEMTIGSLGSGGSGSKSFFELLKGSLNAIVQKLKDGAAFEVHTSDAVAAVKGTQFEVSAGSDESAVTVQEGTVAMSDHDRSHTVLVPRLHRAQAAKAGGLRPAQRLSKGEAKAFQQRWKAAREVHARRAQLAKGFRAQRAQRRADFMARHPQLKQRQRGRPAPTQPFKKAAGERRRARQELRKRHADSKTPPARPDKADKPDKKKGPKPGAKRPAHRPHQKDDPPQAPPASK